MVVDISLYIHFHYVCKLVEFIADTHRVHFIIDNLWTCNHLKPTFIMNMAGPNDLYHFLVGNGLVGICPEAQHMVACMDVLIRMCACDPQKAKQDRLNQCRQHYIAFVSKSPNFAIPLLTKANDNRMQFYLNNQLIATITR